MGRNHRFQPPRLFTAEMNHGLKRFHLESRAGELKPAGLKSGPPRPVETGWFSHYRVGRD